MAENKRRLESIFNDYSICREIASSQSAQITILSTELKTSEQEVKRLTARLNDAEAKVKRLKGKRLWWGVAGIAVGALTYSILVK